MNINGLGYAPYPKGHVHIFKFSEGGAKVSEKAEIPNFEPGKFRSFAEDWDILAIHTACTLLPNFLILYINLMQLNRLKYIELHIFNRYL